MTKIIAIVTAFVIGIAGIWAASAMRTVSAGNVGVKVHLLGTDKGINNEELSPGRYFVTFNEEIFIFPTFTQNYVWTANANEGSLNDESISFQTREGLTVNADVGISYSIDGTKASDIFQKYRKGVEEITDVYLRNMVRDGLVSAGSSLAVESVYGSGKVDLMKQVEETVRAQVGDLGIIIERIYWIGEIRLPESATAAINAKIGATQQAQQRRNEVETAKAEADKVIEEARGKAESVRIQAEAQAVANKLLSESLTPALVEWKALDVWDGVLPMYMGSEGPVPFIDVTNQ